jgi:hypothetical protein
LATKHPEEPYILAGVWSSVNVSSLAPRGQQASPRAYQTLELNQEALLRILEGVPMEFTDSKAEPGKKHTYRVIAVNTVGLKSKPSADAEPTVTPLKP